MAQALVERIAAAELTLSSHGYVLNTSPGCFGELRESNDVLEDTEALRARMAEDGYLFLRGYLDREDVLAVRREFVEKLDSVELINCSRPLVDAIYSGSTAGLAGIDRQAFARSLRTGPALRALCHHGRIITFYERFLGGAVRPFDYIWVRNVRVGAATGVHFDWVYMGRGTQNLYTTWIPIGNVPLSDGPLAILEGSHQIEELRHTYGRLDVDRDKDKKGAYVGGWLTKDAPAVQARSGRRWLTAEFRAGDMLLFGMFTLHCSLDNKSPQDRIRLSVDARYQRASEPADERWVGDEPFGHGMEDEPS